MNTLVVAVSAILLYLAATGLLVRRIVQKREGMRCRQIILALAGAAVLLHGSLLYPRVFSPEGIDLGIFNALSLVAWLSVILMMISLLRNPLENLGLLLFPFSAVALILELLLTSQRIVPAGAPWQLEAHIFVSFLAYAFLGLAMVQAILLMAQERQLRNRRPRGFVSALPPLQVMETLLFRLIGLGFALLTIGLLIGVLFIEDIFASHLVHKTVLSLIAWLLFAILLWGRWRFGWRGRTAIRWTLTGFATLMLAYFGSKLVLELILQR
ncbi:MAG TPA: hypothetical protein ENK54_05190 [Thiotrichales bacterium]|nr:hypothetical protein [Thiotrichales bacterium]